MPADRKNITRVLLELSQPLVIVTVGNNTEKASMTACWLAQISWKPSYVGIAIYQKWRTLELILKFKEFALNLVSKDIAEPALKVFGTMSSRKVDKLEIAKKKYGLKIVKAHKIRAFIILDSPISIECSLLRHYLIGDHYFLICDPLYVHKNNDKKPVTCYRGVPHEIGERVRLR